MCAESEKSLLLAFGANLPFSGRPPEETIVLAISEICTAGFDLAAQSRLWRTPCFPAGAGPDYVNAAARLTLRQEMGAQAILAMLHDIEAKFGRVRDLRWGGRTLDIDLLALDDSILPDAATQRHWMDLPSDRQAAEAPGQPIVPHPRMQDRAFVLVPLAEVAPDWRHPVLRRTVAEMLAALPRVDREAVTPI